MKYRNIKISEYHYSVVRRVLAKRGRRNGGEVFCQRILEVAIDSLARSVLGEDEDDGAAIWWRLHGYWVTVCGLKPLTTSDVDEESMADAIERHGVSGVTEAMDNYREILARRATYAWVPEMGFDEFIVRGVDEFVTSANPHNRYRRVSRAEQMRYCKDKAVSKRGLGRFKQGDLNRIRNELERRLSLVYMGKRPLVDDNPLE